MLDHTCPPVKNDLLSRGWVLSLDFALDSRPRVRPAVRAARR